MKKQSMCTTQVVVTSIGLIKRRETVCKGIF